MKRDLATLLTALAAILHCTITSDWKSAKVNEVVEYDLEKEPLLIKLDPTFFEFPQTLSLALFTHTLGHITTVHLRFGSRVTLEVAHCQEPLVLSKEVGKDEQLWKISKDETCLGIFVDHEEQVRLVIEEQDFRCQEKLSRQVGNVIFVSGTRGAHWKLPSKGDEQCTTLPMNWRHVTTNTKFPVPASSVVILKCEEGRVLEGDSSVVCIQHSSFLWVKGEPRCIEPLSVGMLSSLLKYAP